MAARAQPIGGPQRAGVAAAALVLAVTVLPLGAVALRAEGAGTLGPADWAAVRFTVLQAALSAFFSLVAAVPVARALARRRFRFRAGFITLMGAPFILPVIVATLGLLAVFGRSGVVSQGLQAIGLPPLDIFGLQGVVLAHVFLNLPLAVRLLLHGWQEIPAERVRLAASLGFSRRDMARQFEWPLLRAVAPGALAVIFLICTTSFAVALILGGGPSATTVELAIYQAFRFDFDLGRAALLAVVQVIVAAAAGLLAVRLSIPRRLGAGMDRDPVAWPCDSRIGRIGDGLGLAAAGGFLVLPLALIIARGAPEVVGLPPVVWQAALRSALLALASAALAVLLALALAALMATGRARGVPEIIAALGIAVSPLVMGTGLFLMIRPFADPTALALPVTGLVNALASLPFVLRGLAPALAEAEATQGRLAEALGMSTAQRWRHAVLPRLRRPLGFGAGLAAALSMGDLGVIALFSSPGEATLPMEMYRLMGSYRTNEAEGAAVLLLALSLGLFWAFDRGGRADA